MVAERAIENCFTACFPGKKDSTSEGSDPSHDSQGHALATLIRLPAGTDRYLGKRARNTVHGIRLFLAGRRAESWRSTCWLGPCARESLADQRTGLLAAPVGRLRLNRGDSSISCVTSVTMREATTLRQVGRSAGYGGGSWDR